VYFKEDATFTPEIKVKGIKKKKKGAKGGSQFSSRVVPRFSSSKGQTRASPLPTIANISK